VQTFWRKNSWYGYFFIILTSSKVLLLENIQINLAFCSLNRTFAPKINNNKDEKKYFSADMFLYRVAYNEGTGREEP
jgi:hypothetical protein